MDVVFSRKPLYPAHTQVVGCYEGKILTLEGKNFDTQAKGLLTKVLEANRFKGTVGQTLMVPYPQGIEAARLLIVGLGKPQDLEPYSLEQAGGAIYTALSQTPETEADVHMASVSTHKLPSKEALARLGHGYQLRAWRYDNHKTKKKEKEPRPLKTLCIVTNEDETQNIYQDLKAVAEGVFFTRDLVTMPPNMLYPASMVEKLKALEQVGIELEVLDEKRLRQLGMGSLLGVAQGSVNSPYVVIMKWMGNKEETQPLAFIGKGVTFDSGGLNLKPTGSMEDMKYDMAGAGAVAGIMKTLALRKAKVNAIGAVGLVENMISGSAQRPSDVVTTYSGQTVEVLNTDAEGRLVLCDVMWYVQEQFKPQCMIDLATLTGAIVIALGDQFAGLFSNNDELAQKLTMAGSKVHERVWRLPLHKDYDKQIDSDIADMKNISGGRKAGSITAAQFLGRFTNNVPWAHLDIAAVAWADKPQALWDKGATAFGVRLLDQFLKDNHEQ